MLPSPPASPLTKLIRLPAVPSAPTVRPLTGPAAKVPTLASIPVLATEPISNEFLSRYKSWLPVPAKVAAITSTSCKFTLSRRTVLLPEPLVTLVIFKLPAVMLPAVSSRISAPAFTSSETVESSVVLMAPLNRMPVPVTACTKILPPLVASGVPPIKVLSRARTPRSFEPLPRTAMVELSVVLTSVPLLMYTPIPEVPEATPVTLMAPVALRIIASPTDSNKVTPWLLLPAPVPVPVTFNAPESVLTVAPSAAEAEI